VETYRIAGAHAPIIRCHAPVIDISMPVELPKFRVLTGWEGEYDEDGTLLMRPEPLKPDDAEWPVFLAIRVLDWRKVLGRDGGPDEPEWNVDLVAVAPGAFDAVQMRNILSNWNMLEDVKHAPEDKAEAIMVGCLVNDGLYAPLVQYYSDDANAAVRLAIAEAAAIDDSSLPLYLGRQVNQIGSTGWEFIQGRL
jgi:hypothetical protein